MIEKVRLFSVGLPVVRLGFVGWKSDSTSICECGDCLLMEDDTCLLLEDETCILFETAQQDEPDYDVLATEDGFRFLTVDGGRFIINQE